MVSANRTYILPIIAAAAAILVFASCSGKDEPTEFDREKIPMQSVRDMSVVKSDKGNVSMRMTAPLMQHFEFRKDSADQSYDYYPEGISVLAYTDDGALETTITADEAKHITTKGKEQWYAFGNVVIINRLKHEMMESDTVYWDQEAKKIHTDCYVRLTSETGMMQGYGMVSDERARNSIILKPFDSYSRQKDSTEVTVDTLNFIGPQKQSFAKIDTTLK